MMQQFSVERQDRLAAGRIDDTDETRLFWGYDQANRVFVNIPVLYHHYSMASSSECGFTVYQAYKNAQPFSVSNNLPFIIKTSFLGYGVDFTNLEKLLSGETQRFCHKDLWDARDRRYVDNPELWADIALNNRRANPTVIDAAASKSDINTDLQIPSPPAIATQFT